MRRPSAAAMPPSVAAAPGLRGVVDGLDGVHQLLGDRPLASEVPCRLAKEHVALSPFSGMQLAHEAAHFLMGLLALGFGYRFV